MPATSFQPQSIGTNQLNILAGPFDERSVRKNLQEATAESIIAGRICHEDTDGKAVLGLEGIAAPVSLPLYAFNNAKEPNTRRDNLDGSGDVTQGMMAGGSHSFFRHNANNELATTEFEGLTSDPVGTPLTAYNDFAASDGDATLNGKFRARAASEPVVGYLTRKSYKQADGQTVIAFTPAWIPGTYTP